MPTHQTHALLTQMFFAGGGAPWNYPKWKETTGINFGLFPPNDAHLPTGWTRENANHIQSYFDQYNAKPSEAAKFKFASPSKGNKIPGRDLWADFVAAGWKKWHINDKIVSVLVAERRHPYTIAQHYPTGAGGKVWPCGTRYIPAVLDAVAVDLFGEKAVNALGQVPYELLTPLQGLVQRTWKNLYNQRKRTLDRLEKLEAEAKGAFTDLSGKKLTKRSIKAVMGKVYKWRVLAEILPTPGTLELIQKMDADLVELMTKMGAQQVNGRKSVRATQNLIDSLTPGDDLAEMITQYNDYFGSPPVDDSAPLDDQRPTLNVPFGGEGMDPGTEVEIRMTPQQLAHQLGFANQLPYFFNPYRHKLGLTAWENGVSGLIASPGAATDPQLVKLSLHWHQLAGIHSVLRMIFTPEPNPGGCCGALIADDVGLGKTFQATAIIALFTELIERQKKPAPDNKHLPPFINSNPYLGEEKLIPNLPYLIVCPGTLISQWVHEIKVGVKHKHYDILVYGSGLDLHSQFWADGGPFASSKHELCHRIIITSHTSLYKDFAELYMPPKSVERGGKPWTIPSRLPGYNAKVKSTLFSQKYLVTILDEAHDLRNPGSKHTSALALLKLSKVRLVMTATPLQTSTKDIAAMGRLVGIPHFLSDEALAEEKADLTSIRRAKSTLTDNADDDAAVTLCCKEISARMQKQFENRMLRRTAGSLSWEGKPLLSLPPCYMITVPLNLCDWELKILRDLADQVAESASAGNSTCKVASKNFYIDLRTGVGYARYNTEDPIPKFDTLEQWRERKSTKFDACARMCQHILSRDDAPEMIFQDGDIVFPEAPPLPPGTEPQQKIKILIYQEFTSLGPLLRNVLDLYGIKYLHIEGEMTFEERARVVQQFCDDDDFRVLIFSSVGTVGLNLARACIIFYLDQPWSRQDEIQIRGRALRQGQTRPVTCYFLQALDTADVILAGLARGKGSMMDAFLSQETGQSKF
ncbi:hypothetical protein BDN72DRAFT_776663 [Pluteus cervinus]|uniref:Uncharacterized protein n=1 Tax=Pluteus cervinus TaxID=181527 RepID=A0ACD3AAS9_9AGAR|nr:hypothetical protein BDN72DRAFT_776663 [Pluteus cervinus]